MSHLLKKRILVLIGLVFFSVTSVHSSIQEEYKDTSITLKTISLPTKTVMPLVSTKAPKGMFWCQDEEGCARLQKQVLVPRHIKIQVSEEKAPINIPSYQSLETESLLRGFSPSHKMQTDQLLKEITNKIAANFFPDVFEGKISIESLSNKCYVDFEQIKLYYEQYVQSLTQ